TVEGRSSNYCLYPPPFIDDEGLLRCDVLGGLHIYIFNFDNHRFLEIYTAGYVDGSNDTPHVGGGLCTKISPIAPARHWLVWLQRPTVRSPLRVQILNDPASLLKSVAQASQLPHVKTSLSAALWAGIFAVDQVGDHLFESLCPLLSLTTTRFHQKV